MRQLIREIQKNRELIWALALKELQVRYKRSALGFLWALLNPLLMMIILTMVFSTVMRVPVHDYPVFLISALLPWTFFSQSLAYSVESIVSNGDLLKKVYVAKSVFPLAAIVSNLINFLLSMIPLILLLVVFRFPFYWTWFYLLIPFFLRHGQRFLPRYGPYPPNRSAGLVLFLSDHLLTGFRSGTLSPAVSA